ncbi:hypothetical protein VTN00DRAFT_8853 [Thermoascus crustaceus]|uniref:uncharacterized protein n=1 Tax=Thermoascus crustaceus TaxID=5088 RepID=UPI0037446DE6
MKFQLSAVSLLPLLAAAAPTNSTLAARQDKTPFTLSADRQGNAIHGLDINASGFGFWVGGSPATFCPPDKKCPEGKQTVFAPSGNALDVLVDRGQNIYIDQNGALRYTQAGQPDLPKDVMGGPFIYAPGSPSGHFGFTGSGATGWMACPLAKQVNGQNVYQVFVNMPSAKPPTGNHADCIPFDGKATEWKGKDGEKGAYQYI